MGPCFSIHCTWVSIVCNFLRENLDEKKKIKKKKSPFLMFVCRASVTSTKYEVNFMNSRGDKEKKEKQRKCVNKFPIWNKDDYSFSTSVEKGCRTITQQNGLIFKEQHGHQRIISVCICNGFSRHILILWLQYLCKPIVRV